MPDCALEARYLKKSFGKVTALDGFDLAVESGTIHGLLGPNGAGKSTAVGIFTTLLLPDQGSATVAGHDVRSEPDRVRTAIGMVGQSDAVDEILGGRQNLVMFGRLLGLSRSAAGSRGDELLAMFDLVEAAERPVSTYSGGMRRRLDIAVSLILRPAVLFLDEPTTGLDPRARNEVWSAVRQVASLGTTVLLTTQYLDEADQLADRVAVMDHGRVIADGTPDDLKAQVGGGRVVVRLADEPGLRLAEAVFGEEAAAVDEERRSLTFDAPSGSSVLLDVARRLEAAGLRPDDIGLRPPTLDEAFLALTDGSPASPTLEEAA